MIDAVFRLDGWDRASNGGCGGDELARAQSIGVNGRRGFGCRFFGKAEGQISCGRCAPVGTAVTNFGGKGVAVMMISTVMISGTSD